MFSRLSDQHHDVSCWTLESITCRYVHAKCGFQQRHDLLSGLNHQDTRQNKHQVPPAIFHLGVSNQAQLPSMPLVLQHTDHPISYAVTVLCQPVDLSSSNTYLGLVPRLSLPYGPLSCTNRYSRTPSAIIHLVSRFQCIPTLLPHHLKLQFSAGRWGQRLGLTCADRSIQTSMPPSMWRPMSLSSTTAPPNSSSTRRSTTTLWRSFSRRHDPRGQRSVQAAKSRPVFFFQISE